MNPSSQIIWHQDRGLKLALTRTSAAPVTDITSVLFALSYFCTSCTVNSVSRSSHKNGSKIVSFRLCTGCWEFWTNFKPNQATERLISIEFKIFKNVEISRPFFGMVHVKHIRPWHVAIVGSLFVDCLGRRNQLQNPHKRIPVTFITKPKQWATKMFPVWCDQRSTLGTMCPVRQISFPDTRPAGTVC